MGHINQAFILLSTALLLQDLAFRFSIIRFSGFMSFSRVSTVPLVRRQFVLLSPVRTGSIQLNDHLFEEE